MIIVFSVTFFAGCSKGSKVNVSVVDESGSALSGVSVKMGSYSGTTDDGGRHTFSNVNSGSYTIEASKDGYDNASTDMTVGEVETKEATLTLKTPVTAEEINNINNYSNLNSYMEECVNQKSNGTHQKLIILVAQKGKQKEITHIDFETGETAEIYINGNSARAKSNTGNRWIDVPFSQISKDTAEAVNTGQSIITNVQDWYNELVKTPSKYITIERAGNEIINGYFTIKYVIKEKTTSGSITEADIWKISSGTYKNYVARIIETSIDSKGEVDSMSRVDLSNFDNVVISEN